MADAPAIERAPWWAATTHKFEKANTDKGIAWKRALKSAKLDWDLDKVPLVAPGGKVKFPGAYGVITTEGQPLAVVGERHVGISNADQAKWTAAFADYLGATLVAPWSLHDGRIVGITLCRNDLGFGFKGEPIDGYLNVVNDHGGAGLTVEAFYLVQRSNVIVTIPEATVQVPLVGTNGSRSLVSPAAVADRVLDVFDPAASETFKAMSKAKATGATLNSIITKLWPKPTAAKALAQWENRRAAIVALLPDGKVSTVWEAFHAVAEYVQWVRAPRGTGGNPDLVEAQRAEEILVGYGRTLTEKAFVAARAAAQK